MASLPPDPATEHKQAQEGIAVTLTLAIQRAWSAIFGNEPVTTEKLATFKDAAHALAQHFALAAQRVAIDFYNAERVRQGVTAPFRPPVIPLPTPAQVAAAVDKAIAEAPAGKLGPDAVDAMARQLELVVVDSGRDLIENAATRDRSAIAFARVAKPGACAFCMMLSTRGAVYKTRQSAGAVDASGIWPDAKGEITQWHPGCRCQIVPVFSRAWEPPEHVREATALYERVTGDYRGRGKANAFRRAYERPHIERPAHAVPKKPKVPEVAPSREQIAHHLAVIEAMPPSGFRDVQLQRLRKQLAAAA